MAVAFVQSTAKFTASAASSVTSASITTTSGNKAIITVSTWVDVTNNAPTLTDSKSNTWTNDATVADGSTKGRSTIGSAQLTSAGASHTFTVTGQSAMYFEGNCTEFSGVATSTPVDSSGTTSQGASTVAITATTTGAITAGDDLLVAMMEDNTADSACNITDPPTLYTSIGVNQDSNNTIGYEGCYRILSGASLAAQACAWTYDLSDSGTSAAIVAYKSNGAAAATSLMPIQPGRFYNMMFQF